MTNLASEQKWSWWPLLPLYPYGRKRTIFRELVPSQIWSFEQLQGIYYVAVPVRLLVVRKGLLEQGLINKKTTSLFGMLLLYLICSFYQKTSLNFFLTRINHLNKNEKKYNYFFSFSWCRI